jgi:hypothetical protein
VTDFTVVFIIIITPKTNVPSSGIPLVYVQVVTLAVYSFFFTAVISKQPTVPNDQQYSFLDNLPFFITLQFVFYMGWLKVAETMINPFGDDDDDFDVESMIDSNLILSYVIVDEMHSQYPDLLKDRYWNALPHDSGKKLDGKSKLTDFFDVVGVRKRGSSKKSSLLIPLDKQQGSAPAAPPTVVINVPRSTAETVAANMLNTGVTQTAVEKQLRKTRERAISIKLSEVSSSDDEKTNL